MVMPAAACALLAGRPAGEQRGEALQWRRVRWSSSGWGRCGSQVATLYRHFPTREALVEAVYKDQVHPLTQGAGELLLRLPPSDALRAWMDLFGNWLATMHGMTVTLRGMIGSGEIAHTETRDELLAAIAGILDAGKAAGDLRSDVAADDIAASVIGMFTVTSGQGG